MTTPRLDRDEVAQALVAEDILARYGWRYRSTGGWLRSRQCPACGGGDSEAFSVGKRGFRCHRCDRHGDLLALVALFERLDARRDFARVLEVAASIGGVAPRDRELSVAERAQRRWGCDRRRRELEQRRADDERERYDRAAQRATSLWAKIERRNRDGERYMRQRGLDDLIGLDNIVRYDDRGNVRVPLYDGLGRIVNVPGRYLPARSPAKGRRILSVRGCPTRGTFGHPDSLLDHDGAAVVTEGIFDYLSARTLWPDRAVFGAHGGGNLHHVARLVAERIRETGRAIYLVPHGDDAGIRAARKAWRAAIESGLPRECVRAYDTSDAGDLNDWVCAHYTATGTA